MSDELYELRNVLLLGNYHQVVADVQQVKCVSKKPEDVQHFNTERDLIFSKAQIGLTQYDAVIADLRTATKPTLICARHFASFHKELLAGRADAADAALKEMSAIVGETPQVALADAAVMLCSAYLAKNDLASSLRVSSTWAPAIPVPANARLAIELRALSVDGMLRLNRSDLAEKEVAAMKVVDDEAIHTMICSVMVNIRQGAMKPDRFADAQTTLVEIIGRCGITVSLLNLQAICLLGQGKPAEADRCLLDALAKKSGDVDTISNLAVTSCHLNKAPEVTQRYIAQAKMQSAGQGSTLAPWPKVHDNMENRFREACGTVN